LCASAQLWPCMLGMEHMPVSQRPGCLPLVLPPLLPMVWYVCRPLRPRLVPLAAMTSCAATTRWVGGWADGCFQQAGRRSLLVPGCRRSAEGVALVVPACRLFERRQGLLVDAAAARGQGSQAALVSLLSCTDAPLPPSVDFLPAGQEAAAGSAHRHCQGGQAQGGWVLHTIAWHSRAEGSRAGQRAAELPLPPASHTAGL